MMQTLRRAFQRITDAMCVGLELELFTIPPYSGIVLLDSVTAYLSDLGFELVKKFPAHGTFDSQDDCVFIHPQRDPAIQAAIREVYAIE